MISQNPLTLLTPVRQDCIEKLNAILERFKVGLNVGLNERFNKLGTLHYARWFILREDSFRDKTAIPLQERLVFSSNFDGGEDEHIIGLVTIFPEYFDELYECCEGYPEQGMRNTEARKNYLSKWKVKTAAFYVGAPGRTLQQIKQEDTLRKYLWTIVNSNSWDGKSAVAIQKYLREKVNADPELAWSKQPVKSPSTNWPGMILMSLIMLILLPVILIWILILHFFYERRDTNCTATRSQLNDDLVRRLEADEDLFNQNQFTQVLVMKPGKVRLITVHALMLFARTLIKNLFVKGKLMGIPTIHFARWVLIDNNKHMMFFSNFDGSWNQYLCDFIDKSGWGLTGIFSNTVNFPKTRFLFTGGAYDEEHFLAWSRGTQILTQVWYSAYHHLSIKNIVNNTLIRNELWKDLTEEQAQLFLKRF
ncbi:MAG TPA: hypothetical protein VLM16_01530 [Ginsengibacter sp.]|nr:hypothetical protein [Ginsengibacter sp.]